MTSVGQTTDDGLDKLRRAIVSKCGWMPGAPAPMIRAKGATGARVRKG